MKITLELAQLIDLVDIASRFVAKNATLPILQNIYMKASIDSLIIRSTDMEKYIEIEIPCKILAEGSITINAKTFLDIIRTIEEKEIEINVDQKSQVMTIKGSKDTFEINGIPASEYVALPEVPNDNKITLDAQIFSQGIEKVEYSVTDKNFSPVLTGILLKSKEQEGGKRMIFVGTDSFRLSEYKILSNGNNNEFSLIIPKNSINDFKKIADYQIAKESNEIDVRYSDNLISLQFNIDNIKITATSLLIQGNFPEYDREEIMPNKFNTKILLDKNLCEKAIKKIGILTRDINNFIQIETEKDTVIISSGKTDKGAGTTSLPAIIEGDPITLGVNGRYITDFIKTMEGDELLFNLVDNQKPIIVEDKGNQSYKYVVRPLINN
ncbi:DNA polymerase III subunit beta [Candidatus Gracilibacteria bacterium]|nr:DNA polymerase III subunit beta [Candidatus Gracilibacteria bacterium]